jgi:hypothetical protein
MRRCARNAGVLLLVLAGLAGSACGRYGPPVRASERGAAEREVREEEGLVAPDELPYGDDPIAPDPDAP